MKLAGKRQDVLIVLSFSWVFYSLVKSCFILINSEIPG